MAAMEQLETSGLSSQEIFSLSATTVFVGCVKSSRSSLWLVTALDVAGSASSERSESCTSGAGYDATARPVSTPAGSPGDDAISGTAVVLRPTIWRAARISFCLHRISKFETTS